MASANEEIEAQQLLRLPESFPFTTSASVADLRKHERFNIHRQGLDTDMVLASGQSESIIRLPRHVENTGYGQRAEARVCHRSDRTALTRRPIVNDLTFSTRRHSVRAALQAKCVWLYVNCVLIRLKS